MMIAFILFLILFSKQLYHKVKTSDVFYRNRDNFETVCDFLIESANNGGLDNIEIINDPQNMREYIVFTQGEHFDKYLIQGDVNEAIKSIMSLDGFKGISYEKTLNNDVQILFNWEERKRNIAYYEGSGFPESEDPSVEFISKYIGDNWFYYEKKPVSK